MTDYIVQDKAGNVLNNFRTMEEALKAILMYEAIDKDTRIYTPDFYHVAYRLQEDNGTITYFTL